MKKYISLIIIGLLAVVTIFIFTFISPVSAEEDRLPFRIGVETTKIPVELVPGEIVEGEFNIYNHGAENILLTISIGPFSVLNDNYEADLSTETTQTQITNWIKWSLDTDIVAPDTHAILSYEITVPANAATSGQYAQFAVNGTIINADGSQTNGISINSATIGVTIIGRVRGGAPPIIDTTLVRHDISAPIVVSGNINARSVIRNNGNLDVEFHQSLRIDNAISGELAFEVLGDISFFVWPDTTRTTFIDWPGSPGLGLFRVQSEITYGGRTYEKTATVLVIPLFLLIFIIATSVLLIMYIVYRVKIRRSACRIRSGF